MRWCHLCNEGIPAGEWQEWRCTGAYLRPRDIEGYRENLVLDEVGNYWRVRCIRCELARAERELEHLHQAHSTLVDRLLDIQRDLDELLRRELQRLG